MTKEDIYKTLKKLSDTNGISGHEMEISNIVKEELSKVVDKIEYDNLGSIAAIKYNSKKEKNPIKIMFAAHMDEVGFVISKIEKNGFIKFAPIGGWWTHTMLSQIMTVVTRKGQEYKGVIGSTPPHVLNFEQTKIVQKMDTLFLDIGAKDSKEVESLGIKPGDAIIPTATLFKTPANPDRVLGKAMDNRACLTMGIIAMKEIVKLKDLQCDVYLVGTVQEEVGLRGAKTSAQKWKPDIAFGIDVTIAGDQPGTNSEAVLSSGAALSVLDASTIGNPLLLDYFEKIAKDNKIKYSFDTMTGGGTDTGQLHLANDGAIAMTLSVPARYIHSHYGMVDLNDLLEGAKLMIEFVKKMNHLEIKKISPNFKK